MSGCPFCPIDRRTPWYLHDVVHQVVACEDLESRGYKYRILIVGSGPRHHHPWEDYTEQEKVFLLKLGVFIAGYHIRIGKAKEIVQIDREHFSIKNHGHVQVCMK